MIERLLVFFILFLSILGCTRDDICGEENATTPLVIITFNDIINPTERKSVTNLTVETTDVNSKEVISSTTTDSIAIPLRNAAELTQYRFKKGVGTASPNTDIVTITYTTEDIYVNRACAFKTIYRDIAGSRQSEGSANWIIQINTQTLDIIDETQTHIVILH